MAGHFYLPFARFPETGVPPASQDFRPSFNLERTTKLGEEKSNLTLLPREASGVPSASGLGQRGGFAFGVYALFKRPSTLLGYLALRASNLKILQID